jgi:NhaA family Na+:H+ antiporter
MPIFALTNAGVSLRGTDLSTGGGLVMVGTAVALVAGKPRGVVGELGHGAAGLERRAPGVSWGSPCRHGGGIGFTMSIFISMLAFSGQELLSAA